MPYPAGFYPGTFPGGIDSRLDVFVDWAADGDFLDVGDDVTDDVRPLIDPVTVQYGRDPGPDSSTVAGSGGFTLDNVTRKYSARNTASPLYGKIKPGRPVGIYRTIGGTTYPVFSGRTDSTPVNPDPTSKTVGISIVDYLSDFRGQYISTAVYQGIRTGTAIGYVLDAVGWTGGRDLDPGATVIPVWWEDGGDALTALDNLVRSEGFPALLTVGPSGEIVFRDRHHRITRAASTTVQSTWRGSGVVEPVLGLGFSYDDAWQNIVNKASTEVDTRTIQDRQTVWETDLKLRVTVGAPQTFFATMQDPVVNAVVPSVANGCIIKDPTVVGFGTITATLTRTSGGSIGITLTATGGAVAIVGLKLLAQPVTVAYSQTVSSSDPTSIAAFGVCSFSGDLPWCNAYDAKAILDQAIAARKDPLPVVTARFMIGRDTVAATALLSRDMSDRVRVIEDENVLNDDFHIEKIAHQFTGGDDHEVTFSLEHVPPGTPGNAFRFDTAGSGFDQGVFGS